MQLLPAVRANMQERFLFNFRMPPAVVATLLPVPWLKPQIINDYALVSFCTLNLHHITIAPLPPVAGLHSLSCAYRFAIEDTTNGSTPAVYVPTRYTNSAFGSWFTHLGFSAPHARIHATIVSQQDTVQLRLAHGDGTPLFSARFCVAATLNSALFASCADFATFIKAGVSSYGDSIRGQKLTKVDLHKTDTSFAPLQVLDIEEHLLTKHAGVQFDSALRTAGGTYEWTYYGLVPSEAPVGAFAEQYA